MFANVLPDKHNGIVDILDVILIHLFRPSEKINHVGAENPSTLHYLDKHHSFLYEFQDRVVIKPFVPARQVQDDRLILMIWSFFPRYIGSVA